MAAARVDRDQCSVRAVAAQHRGNRLLGGHLGRDIEGRVDPQAPAEQVLVPLLIRCPQRRIAQQPTLYLGNEVRMNDLPTTLLGFQLHRLLAGRRNVGCLGPTELAQLLEYDIPALRGGVEVAIGIRCRRRLDQARQEGSFGERELRNRFAEVDARRSANAIGAGSEVHRVQVALEDLLLLEALLEAERQDGLFDLAVDGHVGRQEHVLQVLLCDRRAALNHRTGVDVGRQRSSDRLEVQAGMEPETLVLDGDNRIDHVLGKVLVLDEGPILTGMPLRDDGAVGGIDDRGQRLVAETGIIQGLDRTCRRPERDRHGDEDPTSHEARIVTSV